MCTIDDFFVFVSITFFFPLTINRFLIIALIFCKAQKLSKINYYELSCTFCSRNRIVVLIKLSGIYCNWDSECLNNEFKNLTFQSFKHLHTFLINWTPTIWKIYSIKDLCNTNTIWHANKYQARPNKYAFIKNCRLINNSL